MADEWIAQYIEKEYWIAGLKATVKGKTDIANY